MNTVVRLLKREPVAVWGAVLAVIIGALPALGVPTNIVEIIGTVLSLLGIPVVRQRVAPHKQTS